MIESAGDVGGASYWVRDWTLCHRIPKFPNAPSALRPHVIEFLGDFFFFHSGEQIQNIRIHCRIYGMHVDGSRIRKEKVADSKTSG